MKFVSFIVGTVAVGALVGWMAPAGTGPSPEAGESTTPKASAAPDAARRAAWNGGELVLQRSADGHFYAAPVIDGTSARMLVDTGASMVALTAEDAAAIGMTWSPQEVGPVAEGAGGPVYGVRVKIDRIELGEFEAHAVDAVIVPEGLHISLLGQAFLSRVDRVEVSGDRMVLRQ